MKKTINPFLYFNGNCKEAIEYYKEIFNGSLEIMTVKDTAYESQFASENSILHAVLTSKDGIAIMSSDTMIGHKVEFGSSNYIVINFESEEEIDRVYSLFSKDAIKIREELHKAFWGAKYAALVDKFGICWMFFFYYAK